MRYFLSAKPGAMALNKEVLQELFERSPEHFNNVFHWKEMSLLPEGADAQEVADEYANAILVGEMLYFLDERSLALRSDPVLLARLVAEGPCALSDKHRPLKIVEVPDDAVVDIWESDDGREYIAERHRTWS